MGTTPTVNHHPVRPLRVQVRFRERLNPGAASLRTGIQKAVEENHAPKPRRAGAEDNVVWLRCLGYRMLLIDRFRSSSPFSAFVLSMFPAYSLEIADLGQRSIFRFREGVFGRSTQHA
jgi:hypothetical protein